jgi:hypothetical protein
VSSLRALRTKISARPLRAHSVSTKSLGSIMDRSKYSVGCLHSCSRKPTCHFQSFGQSERSSRLTPTVPCNPMIRLFRGRLTIRGCARGPPGSLANIAGQTFTRAMFSTLNSDLDRLIPGSFRHIRELSMRSGSNNNNKI